MTIQDVDEYLGKLSQTRDEAQKLELTKKIWEKMKKINNFINSKEFEYFINSGAFERCFIIGFKEIPEMAIVGLKILNGKIKINIDTVSLKGALKTNIGQALKNGEFLNQNGKTRDFNGYDVILFAYLVLHTVIDNIPIDDITKDAFDILQKNLPKDMSIRDTSTYKQLVKNLEREDIKAITPQPNKEELVELLKESNGEIFGEDGKIKNIIKYDDLLFEYLMFFAKDRIDFNVFTPAFKLITENFKEGKLRKSKVYSDFLIKREQTADVQGTLDRFNIFVVNDILDRIYKGKPEEESCSKEEFKTCRYLWNGITSGVDINSIGKMVDTSYPKEILDFAKKIIRLQNGTTDRPKNSQLAQIFDMVKNTNILGLLRYNIDPYYMSVEPRYLEYADEALALIFEGNFEYGYGIFNSEEVQTAFKNGGVHPFDSKAMEKMVEIYLNKPELYEIQENTNIEELVKKYITYKASKKDFNILKEQGVSDLLQLMWMQSEPKFERFKSALFQGIVKSEAYMPVTDAREKTSEFIKQFKNIAITSENETEFLEFLKALSMQKMMNLGAMLTQEQVDFVLGQALRKDSIIHKEREKYRYVVERALEDLGRLDNYNNNCRDMSRCLIRDNLDEYSILGDYNKKDRIRLIREDIEKFYDGDFSMVKTIFHENYHYDQIGNNRLKHGIPKTFIRYNILREEVLEKLIPNYYKKNYEFIYSEIEAEEISSLKAAEYMSRIVPEENIQTTAESIKDGVVEMFDNKFLQEQQRLRTLSEKKREDYQSGFIKKDRNGVKRPISDILDSELSKLSPEKVESILAENPGLLIEYTGNGSEKRAFSDILRLAGTNDYDLDMMRHIIRTGHSILKENEKGIVKGLYKLMIEAKTPEQSKFVNDVISDNLGIYFEKYASTLSIESITNNEGTINPELINLYRFITSIAKIDNSNRDTYFLEGFYRAPEYRDGKTPMEALRILKCKIEELVPNIGVVAKIAEIKEVISPSKEQGESPKSRREIISRIFRGSYYQLKNLATYADIEGKQAVKEYERGLQKIPEQR